MSDQALEIQLKVLADTHGAAAVSDALKKVTAETGHAAEAAHKGAHAHELMGLKGRQLHKIMHELGHAFPEAGLLMRAFFSPIGAAAGIAVGAFVKIKESIDEMNKKLDEAGKIAGEKMGNFADSFREAGAEAKLSMEELNRELETAATKQQTLAEKTAAVVETIHLQAAAMQEVENAAEAAATAQINAQEKAREIDSETAIKRRAAIVASFAAQKEQIKIKEQALEVSEKQKLAKDSELAQVDLADKSITANIAAKDPARVGRMGTFKETEEGLKKQIDAAKEAEKEAAEKRDKGGSLAERGYKAAGGTGDVEFEKKREERANEARTAAARVAELQSNLGQWREQHVKDVSEQKRLDDEAAKAKSKAEAAPEAARAAAEDARKAKEKQDSDAATRAAVKGYKAQETAAGAPGGATVYDNASVLRAQVAVLTKRLESLESVAVAGANAGTTASAQTGKLLDVIARTQATIDSLNAKVAEVDKRSRDQRIQSK